MKSEEDHPRRKARAGHVWVLPVLLVLLSACGYQEDSAPVLTGIAYPRNPWRFLVGYPRTPGLKGEATPYWGVDFEDPDGDLVLLHVRWQDCGTGPVKELDILQEGLEDVTSGTIGPFWILTSTDCPLGVYVVKLSVSDGQGNRSNVLELPYEIYEVEE